MYFNSSTFDSDFEHLQLSSSMKINRVIIRYELEEIQLHSFSVDEEELDIHR
jgi:hypothetical protein